MGIAIPQVITSDKATGAQVIDGSLKFDQATKTYLTRTPGSAGNRKEWTLSYWIKFYGDGAHLFSANNDAFQFESRGTGQLLFANSGSTSGNTLSTSLFRDNGQFYHVVIHHDAANTIARFYINGEQNFTATLSDADGTWNNATSHNINGRSTSIDSFSSFGMSQVYFIDGAALEPTEFGFTDPLTNIWKPKKFDIRAQLAKNPNNGTTWSNSLTTNAGDNFDGSGAKTKAFDGTENNKAFTANNSDGTTQGTSYLEMVFPSAISGALRVKCDNGNTVRNTTGGGDVLLATQSTGSDNQFVDCGTVSGLTNLRVLMSGGSRPAISIIELDGYIFIDGLSTDNSFYLPMDGNSPIGQDQSGNGNDWTPVNFGGSVELDNPQVSGARPILNTTQGGSQAGVGVFGSKQNVGYAVTVYNDGGGNKYYIDGVKQDTVTGLIRGATYTFDTSDSTVSSHPFRFSATSNGSHGGGSEYTNGVAAITGAATTITVPYNAPETLYYYCTSHSGMGADITGITTNEKLADQYASHCTLALPLVGGDDDVCASIACTANNKTPTNSSVTAATTQSNFYSGSHYWSANSDTLQYAEQGDELVFGAGDYTIECWLYDDNGHNGTSNRCYIFDNRIGGSVVGDPPTMTGYVDSHNEFNFGDGTNTITHTVGTTVGKWWHYAVTREGTTTRMFIDGILRGSATSSTSFTNNGIGVGRATDGGYGWSGYIQDFRVYKGIAKYTSDFVIPATSPDVLPDTPSGVSGGSKLTKITDGAVSFDGTDSHLNITGQSDVAFGTGDFTLECFVYFASADGTLDTIMETRSSTSASDGFLIGRFHTSGHENKIELYTASDYRVTADVTTPNNTWVHVAAVRSSSVTKLYINGKAQSTTYSDTNDYSNDDLIIGENTANQYQIDGFISNFRLVKGTALYTSNFTPPTAPLTNVTNTKLLCCQSNASSDAAAVQPSVTSYFTGGTALTWASSPIGSKWTLSNSNKNATSSGGSGYTGADVFSVALAANTTYAWTLDVTNGDSTGGWYFADVQSNTGTHADQKGGNSLGLRGGETSAGYYGTFASANGGSNGENKISMNSNVSPNGAKSIDFVVYRPSSGTGKVWVKANDTATWIGGGNPSDTSSTATFIIPDGTTYFGFIDYDSGDTTNCNMRGDGDITSPPLIAHGDASATNFNPFNTDINTVRGQETVYPILNPLDMRASTVLSNGNLTVTGAGAAWYLARSTQFVSTGKYYWEYKWYGGAVTESSGYQMGLKTPTSTLTAAAEQAGSFAFQYTSIYQTAGSTNTVVVSPGSITPGDCVMFAYDADAGLMWFGVNGKWNDGANPASGSNSDWTSLPTTGLAPFAGVYNTTIKIDCNFGQKPFKYAPPDGFQPINGANVRPETVIARPDQYVGIVTYTGDGNSPRKISGYNFAPDLIWYKQRNSARDNQLYDTVRGSGSNKNLSSNTTYSETANDDELYGYTSAFNDNGFTVTTGSSNFNYANASSSTYVAWAWKAGGSKNTFNVDDVGYASAAAAGLTAGDITPTGASVGTKQGFSIIRWTAPTWNGSPQQVPHGLTQSPSFIIAKVLNDTASWVCYHKDLDASNPQNKYLTLNSNSAVSTLANGWGTSAPNSTTFGDRQLGWSDGKNVISYIWHDVPGLQKFGTYEANGSTDGPYVELGFTPAVLMLKNYDDTEHWYVYDPERSPHNVAYQSLLWSSSNAENTGASDTRVDLLSNGFKLRQTNGPNTSGDGYIYAAWAAAPSVDLFGGGANAR